MLPCHIRLCLAARAGLCTHTARPVNTTTTAAAMAPTSVPAVVEHTDRLGEAVPIDAAPRITPRVRTDAHTAHKDAVCVPASPRPRLAGVGGPTPVRLSPARSEAPHRPTPASASDGATPTGATASGAAAKPAKARSPHEDLFVVDSVRQALENLLGGTHAHRAPAPAPTSESEAAASASPPAFARRARRHASARVPPAHEELEGVSAATRLHAPPAEEAIDAAAVADLEDAREEDEVVLDATDAWDVPTVASASFGSAPCMVSGEVYPASIADVLAQSGAACGFHSPVWATRAQFARLGFEVGGADAASPPAGVVVDTTNASVTLYNLEQTTGQHATAAQLVDLCRAHDIRVPTSRWVAQTRGGDDAAAAAAASREAWARAMPRDLRGLGWFGAWDKAIRASPQFTAWQTKSPFWLTLQQLLAVKACVREEEMAHAVVVPSSSLLSDSAESSRSRVEPLGVPASDAVLAAHAEAAQADGDAMLLYNAAQLTTPDRFAVCHFGMRAGCYNKAGRRYGPVLSFLLLEYAHAHHFTLADPLQEAEETVRGGGEGGGSRFRRRSAPWTLVFCTEAHVQRLGGVVLPWPPGATADHQTPPFTALASDGGFIVLYNAEQTTVYEELKRACVEQIATRQDYFRARHST